MAMRRPRIKPVANILLNSKRKPKPTNDVKPGNVVETNVNNSDHKGKDVKDVIPSPEKDISNNVDTLLDVREESTFDTKAVESKPNYDRADRENSARGAANLQTVKTELSIAPICEDDRVVTKVNDSVNNVDKEVKETIKNDSEAFKCPQKVGFQRAISHISNSGLDDVFYSDIEENALQMDLEKSNSNCPMSPSKNMARPRIRPTPHFGQRRNSYVGSSPSPHTSMSEDNAFTNSTGNTDVIQHSPTKRERHHSASISSNSHSSVHHHTPHKYLPAGIMNSSMGRIRTESGCSVFSDNNTSSHKSRKIDDHKLTARKDFEARFIGGVPEKSLIKMSDLIFYNPKTNPMEQKPIPNVKLEQNEDKKDVKPYIEKPDISTNTSTDDTEAVPVPQLKLNAKGELILDDKSLVIETTAEQEARKALANSSLIYLDEYTGMNGFYSRKSRTRVWLHSDTIKFYRCLQNVGTDFSLMVSLFPNRTRRDLKLKFKKEERKNGHLISKALLYPKQFDIESLKQQLEEEEKSRGEKVIDKNKAPKKEKKKINCQSKATRVLLSSVYENENNQPENKINSNDVPLIEKSSHTEPVQIDKSENDAHEEPEKKIKVKKMKKSSRKLTEVEKLLRNYENEKRRKDRYYANKRRRKQRLQKLRMRQESTVIKEEIKTESRQDSNDLEFQDIEQLDMEMDDLLNMDDALDTEFDNTHKTPTLTKFGQYNEQNDATSQDIGHTAPFTQNAHKNEIDKYEHKTFVNLDDGSLSVYSNIKDDIVFINSTECSSSLSPAENEKHSLETPTIEPEITNNESRMSVISEPELNEADIQSILTELVEGSLVLVSSLDPDNPDKVLNEIYMVDKNTGELCDEPLNIPDNIVQCILAVAS